MREIKWNAINLKREIRLASRDVNFYKPFFQGLNRQVSQTSSTQLKKGRRKAFQGYSESRYVF